MNSENDHSYFRCKRLGKSRRASEYWLESNAQTYWVPNSLHEFRQQGTCPETGYETGIIEVESWFSNKEGMSD